jgi:hypothetical protein
MMKQIVTTAVFLGMFWASAVARPITQANWYHHPRIEAIRTEYNAIEQQIKNHRYHERKKTIDNYNVVGNAHLFTDGAGHVRKLVIFEGTGDSAASYEYSYRTDGSLLFSWYEDNNYMGMHYAVRSYFAPDGSLLFRKVDNRGGSKPARPLDIRNPREAFRVYNGL